MAAGSGILYGSINVLAKPLPLHPFVKAAIAYLASAVTLAPFLRGLRIVPRDWPKVLAMGLVGAGVSPVLLFYGLRETAAADAGLLLTLEMVATATLAYAFLRERFRGGVLSVHKARVFKPAPDVYAIAEETLGVPRSLLGFVSSNGWDAAGAKTFGFRVFWINRSGAPVERLGVRPDAVIKSLAEVEPLLA